MTSIKRRPNIVAGGGRPQVRRASNKNWTKARRDAFLTVLSETCNVTLAAQEAGVR